MFLQFQWTFSLTFKRQRISIKGNAKASAYALRLLYNCTHMPRSSKLQHSKFELTAKWDYHNQWQLKKHLTYLSLFVRIVLQKVMTDTDWIPVMTVITLWKKLSWCNGGKGDYEGLWREMIFRGQLFIPWCSFKLT